MRLSIILIKAFAIAISVSSSNAQKSKVSETFTSCSEKITKGAESIANIKKELNGVASNPNSFNDMTLYKLALTTGGRLKTSHRSCCDRFAPNMDEEHAKAIVAFLSSITEEYVDLLPVIVSEKPIIGKTERSIRSIRFLVENIKYNMDKLLNCLNFNPSANGTLAMIALFEKLNKAYSIAHNAYGFEVKTVHISK